MDGINKLSSRGVLPWKYKNYEMKDNAVELGIGFDDVKLLRNILITIAVHSHIKFA